MNRKVLIVFLYLYAAFFSIAKTLRLPNDWAEAHWMLDYRFGFIKRGLAGEIFRWVSEKNEFNIIILSAGILFLLYLFIIIIAVRETWKRFCNLSTVVFFLIFFLSQYLIFSAHLIGYLDHIVFLFAIAAVYLIRRDKIVLSSIIAAIGILIHEISFFLLLPVCCTALICSRTGRREFSLQDGFSKDNLKRMALFLTFPVLTTLLVIFCQEQQAMTFQVVYDYLRTFPFITAKAADSVSSAYTKSFLYYLKDESGHFLQRLFISKATILYGIPQLLLLRMLYRIFNLKGRFLLLISVAAAAFVPLLLNAIAFDTYRIWTFPYMILFLEFWVLSFRYSADPLEKNRLTSSEWFLFVLAAVLAGFVPNVLFDGETERFSIALRFLLLLPVAGMLYWIQKAPADTGGTKKLSENEK